MSLSGIWVETESHKSSGTNKKSRIEVNAAYTVV